MDHMVTSYCPLFISSRWKLCQRLTFQLHPDVLQAADRVPPFCSLSLLSAPVLVSSSPSLFNCLHWQKFKRFKNNCFRSAFKLFKNILAWQGTLSDALLVELALDRLLNRCWFMGIISVVTISWVHITIFRYLLLSLRANRDPLDSVDKARQILQVLLQWSWLWST